MPLNKQSEPSVAGSEPPTKKVKFTNKGSEIKQMRIMAEVARKPVIPSPQSPQPSASKHVLSNKTNIQTRPSGGKPVLPRSDIETAKPATTKQLLASQNVTLQRMSENSIKAIQNRREAAQMALDAIFPLMKKSHAVGIAVAALQQQVEDCTSDIRKLKRFMRTAQTGSATSRELKALVTLASLVPDSTKKPKAEQPEASKTRIIQDGTKKCQNAENVRTARSNNRTSAAVPSNDKKVTTDHSSARKHKVDAHRAESNSATPRASTPKTHMPSSAPISRTPQALSTAEAGKNISQVAPKTIVSTAHPRSGGHPRSAMGGGLTTFLKKNHFGPYSGDKRKRGD